MPKLWNETIETHRREVHDAILSTAASLVLKNGLLSVTMSQIAEAAGIGRATLYKYFPDIESILVAWHSREIARHVEQLLVVRDLSTDLDDRLRSVLTTYALNAHQSRGHLDAELVRSLHRGDHVGPAQEQIRELLSGLIGDAASAGLLRGDVPAGELADYCLHALSAAGDLHSEAATRRLVRVTLAGLRPEPIA